VGNINFFELIGPGGKAGARERFEALVSQLVRLRFGNATMRIQAQGGDWGLDTIVGDLGDGVIEAFQAKFFIDGIDGPQQAQIRKSFDAAIVGRKNGHELASWTLCIPVCLNPGSARWWSGWKARSEAKFSVRIDLWDATTLEAMLLEPPAAGIRASYFPRTAPVAEQARRRLEGQRSLVREVAPERLRDREEELDALREFVRSDDRYLHVIAPPWAGKTALVASFVLDPPPEVEVVSFFVTAGLAARNDSQAFAITLTGQLAALAEEPLPSLGLEQGLAETEYRRLLEQAAARVRANGRWLVLAVDGLDEDEGLSGNRDLPSIASLLPRTPIAGLSVLVSSRPHPEIPSDTHPEHPLRAARKLAIAPSPDASEIGRLAERELMGHLMHEETAFDIIGCLCAAGDGLGVAELAEVIGEPRHRVKWLIERFFGRSMVSREAVKGEEAVLFFGHAALRETAGELVADRIELWQHRLDAWADRYRDKGWPAATPRYLVWSYGQALADRGEFGRMFELACDGRRADLLADRTGGDGPALEELLRVERALREQGPTDLLPLARLAVHRTRLTRRSARLPKSLPALWAALGEVDRAARIAGALAYSRASSLESAISTLIDMQRWADAERLLGFLPTYNRDKTAKSLADALASSGRLDPAERIQGMIGQRGIREAASAAIVEARFGVHEAAQDWDECEAFARSIDDEAFRLRLLSRLARLVAPADPARAYALATELCEPLESEPPKYARETDLLREVAETLWSLGWAVTAERFVTGPAGGINRDVRRAEVAQMIAVRDPDRALSLLETDCNTPIQRHVRLIEALAGAALYVDRQDRPRTLGRRLSKDLVRALREHRDCSPLPGAKADPMLLHAALSASGELAISQPTDEVPGLVDACVAARDWESLRGLLAPQSTYRGGLDPEAAVAHARSCASWLDSATPEPHFGPMADALEECEGLSPDDEMLLHACRGDWVSAERSALSGSTSTCLEQLCLWRGLESAWEDAFRISNRLGDSFLGIRARTELARQMAAAGELDRAERVLASLSGPRRERALAAMAAEVAAGGAVSSAMRLAERLRDDYRRAELFALMAKVAPSPQARGWAEHVDQLVGNLPGDVFQAQLLTTLAEAEGAWPGIGREAHLDRATDLARSLNNSQKRVGALARLARATLTSDPSRAAELAADAVPLIGATDSDAAETVAEVLGLQGRWSEAEKAMRKLGGSYRQGTRGRLARIAIREDLRLTLRLCDPGPRQQDWWGYHNRSEVTQAAAAVATALCRRGRSEDAASFLLRHPTGLKAAILGLESHDPEVGALVEVAIELMEALPDVQRESVRSDLVRALVAGGRLSAAEPLVRSASARYRKELMISISTELVSTGRHEEALPWARTGAEQGERERMDVALAFADSGQVDAAIEFLGEEAPWRDVGISIARGLALDGRLEDAEWMIGRLPAPERAGAWSAVGLALASSQPQQAHHFALAAESASSDREPLGELAQLVAVELPVSSLRSELVELASRFESAPFSTGFTVLLYQHGHRAAAAARLPKAFRDELRRTELGQVASYEAASAGSEPDAVVGRLSELALALAGDNPYMSADTLCVFAGALATRQDCRVAARLLIDRALGIMPEVAKDRVGRLFLSAAKAIAPADTDLASTLLRLAATAVRSDVPKAERSRAVMRLARIEARLHGVAAAESAVLGFDAADRGLALADLCECPRADDSMPWQSLLARAEHSADDTADESAASNVLTWLACAVAAKDPESADRLASAAIYDDEDWSPMTGLVSEFLAHVMVGEASKVMSGIPAPWNEDFERQCDAAVKHLIRRGDWQRAEQLALHSGVGAEALKAYINALARAGRWDDVTRLGEQVENASTADPLLMAIAFTKSSTETKPKNFPDQVELRKQGARLLHHDHWEGNIWLLNQIDGRITKAIAEEALSTLSQ
jgi:hypothetical protein